MNEQVKELLYQMLETELGGRRLIRLPCGA